MIIMQGHGRMFHYKLESTGENITYTYRMETNAGKCTQLACHSPWATDKRSVLLLHWLFWIIIANHGEFCQTTLGKESTIDLCVPFRTIGWLKDWFLKLSFLTGWLVYETLRAKTTYNLVLWKNDLKIFRAKTK